MITLFLSIKTNLFILSSANIQKCLYKPQHNTETVPIGIEDIFHMVPSTCPGGQL